MNELRSVRFTIRGQVQGVFYRQHTCAKAGELGITGWVRNMRDGSVLILATGTEEQLNKFSDWCHRGSPRSQVTAVERELIPLSDESDFRVLPTG
ncbi:MAG: hypothetical protein RJA57_1476 [Bacteroidota bacterium]|jgi:acylphosphatase